jgi:hypothetical protein
MAGPAGGRLGRSWRRFRRRSGVVQIVNAPPSSQCKFPTNDIPQGVCWVVVNDWQPLPSRR